MKTIVRKIISTIILGAVAVSFSACAGSQLPEQQYKELNLEIKKFPEHLKMGANSYLKPYAEAHTVQSMYSDTSYIANLKEIANVCQLKGFKYFEIIRGNDLESEKELIDNKMPITTIKDYIAFKGFNGGNINEGHTLNAGLKYVYVNYRNTIPETTFVWNCENVIKEEVVLTNPFSMKEKESEAVKWNEWTKRTFDKTNIKYTIINRD